MKYTHPQLIGKNTDIFFTLIFCKYTNQKLYDKITGIYFLLLVFTYTTHPQIFDKSAVILLPTANLYTLYTSKTKWQDNWKFL